MALYQNQNRRFFVTETSGDSPSFPLAHGIRQECPLSPYLFIIVLYAVTTDLHSFFQEISSYTPWTLSNSHPLSDVEYADDTVLIARTHETLSRLLHLLQHLAARTGLLLNGSKCQLLAIHGSLPVSLSPYMLMHIGPAIVHAVPHSFRFHLVKALCVLPLSHCKVLNISVPTLLLPHLPYQMLTVDVPRHPLPSKPWILFSDILSFPQKLNYGSTHGSFRLMVQNHKCTLQHKLPKWTVYITKLSDKYPRSRAHSTIESVFLLTPLAGMNTCFPFHTRLFRLVFLHPFKSQIPGWNT